MERPAAFLEAGDTPPPVSVFVRVRPLISREAGSDVLPGLALCSSGPESAPAVALESGKVTVGGFAGVQGQEADNQAVFESCFAERLKTVMRGGAASLFCYGYTGGGKTHTMLGKQEERGMYYLAAQQILRELRDLPEMAGNSENEALFLHATACEIYNGKVFDLLGAEKLECTLRTDEAGTLKVLGPAVTVRVDELEKHVNVLVGQLTDEQLNEMQQARDRFDETGMPSVFDGTLHSTATTRSEGLRSVSVFCLDDLERISRSCLQNRAIGTSTQHEESSRSHAVLRMEIVTQAVLDARQALDDARALLPAFQNALDNLTNVACKLLFERDPYGRYNAIGCTDPCGRCSAEGPAPDPIWDPEDSGGLRRRHFREPGLWESRHAALRAQRRGLEESLAGARAEAKRASGALAALLERGPASLGGSLVLVDLAGADYDHRAGAQQRESAEINKSLLALKECLRALASKSPQRPKFRDSKLTRIMEDSLAPAAASGRRCRESTSVMVVNVSPAAEEKNGSLEEEEANETLQTQAEELACLRWEGEGGCEALRDQARCLGGRDGRPWAAWKGLLVAGQPCSWCGGERCGEGSAALCVPHDWVRQRAGISTANCSSGAGPAEAAATAAAAPNASAGGGVRWEEPERGARCAADRMEGSERFNRYYWTFSAASAGECRAICASQPYCRGFGFEAAGRVCRAWWHSIDSTVPSPDAGDECVRVAAAPAAGLQQGLAVAAARALPDVGGFEAGDADRAAGERPSSPPALAGDAGAEPGGALAAWTRWVPAGGLVVVALACACLVARARAAPRMTRAGSLEEGEGYLDEETSAVDAAAAERQLFLSAGPPVEPLAAWSPPCEPVFGGVRA